VTCKEAEKWLDTDPDSFTELERLETIDHLRTCKACQPIYMKRVLNGIQLRIDAANKTEQEQKAISK
jgi:hypothetical protein